ncbi:MAG TPA: N-acetylmuramoyl-L-alanine amidase [Hyphomicrobiaceae bacterium]|nr:N-acetylmuramoyl-L-alanine amidase [Hyphomicrobiaceae bacterium]
MIQRPDTRLAAKLFASPNIEPRKGNVRPSILLLHYTGMASAASAIQWLATPAAKVSCHYVVDEAGEITQMVAEGMRAWHAGVAHWAGESDINSQSIGIEIQNPGHDLGYPDFPEAQIAAVIALSRDIVLRNSIPPQRVLAHSDVAPMRKIDPGEKFPWGQLAAAGVGFWPAHLPVPVDEADPGDPAGEGRAIDILDRLAAYGYGIDRSSEQRVQQHRAMIAAFQRHFRPARVDGRVDRSTIATLDILLEALPVS